MASYLLGSNRDFLESTLQEVTAPDPASSLCANSGCQLGFKGHPALS